MKLSLISGKFSETVHRSEVWAGILEEYPGWSEGYQVTVQKYSYNLVEDSFQKASKNRKEAESLCRFRYQSRRYCLLVNLRGK